MTGLWKSLSTAEATAWRLIVLLSILEAGAYVGNEAARYFWDLTTYVEALDTAFPYRFDQPYPFLYPPIALDLFRLARSHLFELFSIAYVGAVALFLGAYARLAMRRRFEWLLAVGAMGGLGVVSVLSGNVGNVMNLALLGVAFQAAMGNAMSLQLLPVAIGLGALIKPQFALYLGLLLSVERSAKTALIKMVAVGAGVIAIHLAYLVLRPDDWNEYMQAIVKRTVVGNDFGWGPAGFVNHFTESHAGGLIVYLVALIIVGALAFATWRRSRTEQPVSPIALLSLAFIVLTFANPRMPLYDLFAAAIALGVCCAFADRSNVMAWALVLALVINLPPWVIANFARVPSAWPWWLRDLQIGHLVGIGILLVTLSRVGMRGLRENAKPD